MYRFDSLGVIVLSTVYLYTVSITELLCGTSALQQVGTEAIA